MRVALVTALMFTLLVGVGAIIFYYAQDYNYSLDLKNNIPTSDIHVTLTPGWSWNGTANFINESAKNIESISMSLGKMKFKNDGVISRIIEVPKLIACFDLKNTAVNQVEGSPYTFALWPIYTTYEPVFDSNLKGWANPQQIYGSYDTGIATEIYSQNIYRRNYGQQPIEVNAGDELIYYISLKNSYVSALGNTPTIFKNGKIEIYELPTEEFNPISLGVTYDSLIYNPTCDALAQEFDPVKTIEVI